MTILAISEQQQLHHHHDPSKAKALFDDDGDGDESQKSDEPTTRSIQQPIKHKLQINQKYASDFEARKQREELKQFRRIDDDLDGKESSSSSSSEDEDGELWDTQTDTHIWKTLNAIRSQNHRIYDPSTRFFPRESSLDDSAESTSGEEEDAVLKHNGKKSPRVKHYKDVVREQILDQIEQEENQLEKKNKSDNNNNKNKNNSENVESNIDGQDKTPSLNQTHIKSRFAYDATQEKIRHAFLKSSAATESDEDWITLKKKKKREDTPSKGIDSSLAAFTEELSKWEANLDQDDCQIVDPRGELPDGERYLLEFFKNRSWVDQENDQDEDEEDEDGDDKNNVAESGKELDDADSLLYTNRNGGINPPSTNDLISTGREADDDASLDELDKADDFEAQYNFRFEQAVAASIGSHGAAASGGDHSLERYSRGQEMNTLRRKDSSRKEKRVVRQERKAIERAAKEEQLRRLKNAKRADIQRKLAAVKAVLGEVGDIGGDSTLDEATILQLLEGDFDLTKFESLMKKAYDDNFYDQTDVQWKSDKDVRDSLRHDEDGDLLIGQDDEDGGLYDNYEAEDEGDDQDCEEYETGVYDNDLEFYDEANDTELEAKVKSKLMDELYQLDYEDIVAGQPTRFKYRKVAPNSFGLSAEEILLARDSALKQFVSLKKIAPYHETEHFVGSNKRRRFRELLKCDLEEANSKTLFSTAAIIDSSQQQQLQHNGEESTVDQSKSKKRKRNRRLKNTKMNEAELPMKELDPACYMDIEKKLIDLDTKRREDRVEPINHELTSEGRQGEEDKLLSIGHHSKKTRKRKKKKKKAKDAVEGISAARLASYGL